MRTLISYLLVPLIIFLPCDWLTGYRNEPEGSPVIQRLSKKNSAPFGSIKILGSGFTTTTDMVVVFSAGSYKVEVQPVQASSTSLSVSVPFFTNASSVPAAGVVSVSVRSKSSALQSNSVAGFRITNLPVSSAPPGDVTRQFLFDLQILLKNAVGSLSFVKSASKGAVNTGPLIAKANALSKQVTALLNSISQTSSRASGSSLPFGPVTINQLDSASLALSDRMILGAIAQINKSLSAPARNSSKIQHAAGFIPSIRDSISRIFQTTDQKTIVALETILGGALIVAGFAIYINATVPVAIAAAVVIGGLGVVAFVSGASTILKEALYQESVDSGEAGDVSRLYGQNPAATTPTYDGTIGSILQKANATVKGFGTQVAQAVTKAVEPQNQQNISNAFKKNDLNGQWKGRYSSIPGSGALSATISQSSVFFSANVTVERFGGGKTSGAINGTVIDVGSVFTQGCTISIYNGRHPSPNSLNGQFTVTGDCLKPYNLTKISGIWDLFRPV